MGPIRFSPTQTRENTTLADPGLQVRYAEERVAQSHYTDPKLKDLSDTQAISNVLARIAMHEINIPSGWLPRDARPGESVSAYIERTRNL